MSPSAPMRTRLLAVASAIFVFSAFAAPSRGILCLTFDDRGLDGWTNSIPLFARYGAHASFFVSGKLGTNELVRMKALADAGHTVGIHTVGHRDVPRAFAEEGPSTFFRMQIEPQCKAMKAFGLEARYLAYPNNRHDDETDAVLSYRGFARFRAGAKLLRDGVSYYSPSNRAQLVSFNSAFFPVSELSSHRVMEGVGVGKYYHTDIEDILLAIRRAAERNEVITIFSHAIRPDAKGVNMKTDWLVRILETAKGLGLDVRGFGELGEVVPRTSWRSAAGEDSSRSWSAGSARRISLRGTTYASLIGGDMRSPFTATTTSQWAAWRVLASSMNFAMRSSTPEARSPRRSARREFGMSRVDLLVHGITPETGGWKPFPSREAFVKYLDGIKACEQRGEIKVVAYGKLLEHN